MKVQIVGKTNLARYAEEKERDLRQNEHHVDTEVIRIPGQASSSDVPDRFVHGEESSSIAAPRQRDLKLSASFP